MTRKAIRKATAPIVRKGKGSTSKSADKFDPFADPAIKRGLASLDARHTIAASSEDTTDDDADA